MILILSLMNVKLKLKTIDQINLLLVKKIQTIFNVINV